MNSLEKSLTNEINNYLTLQRLGGGGERGEGGRGPMDPPANLSVIT